MPTFQILTGAIAPEDRRDVAQRIGRAAGEVGQPVDAFLGDRDDRFVVGCGAEVERERLATEVRAASGPRDPHVAASWG